MKKEQFCDWCGESCGVFEHSRRFDGPVSCGAAECEREIRRAEQGRIDEARADAEFDGFSRYL